MAKCTQCGLPLDNEDDRCSCNESLCKHCCDCGKDCGCGCKAEE